MSIAESARIAELMSRVSNLEARIDAIEGQVFKLWEEQLTGDMGSQVAAQMRRGPGRPRKSEAV